MTPIETSRSASVPSLSSCSLAWVAAPVASAAICSFGLLLSVLLEAAMLIARSLDPSDGASTAPCPNDVGVVGPSRREFKVERMELAV